METGRVLLGSKGLHLPGSGSLWSLLSSAASETPLCTKHVHLAVDMLRLVNDIPIHINDARVAPAALGDLLRQVPGRDGRNLTS